MTCTGAPAQRSPGRRNHKVSGQKRKWGQACDSAIFVLNLVEADFRVADRCGEKNTSPRSVKRDSQNRRLTTTLSGMLKAS